MRWYIIRTLLVKETLRHLAERGGIFLSSLLIAASLLVSLFGREDTATSDLLSGVRRCYVDFWEDTPWVRHLRAHPPAVKMDIRFRPVERVVVDERGVIAYDQSTAAIQIRNNGKDANGRNRYLVMFWQPGKDPSVIAPYAEWFWKETLRYYQQQEMSVEIETSEEEVMYPGEMAIIVVGPGSRGDSDKNKHKLLYRRIGKDDDTAQRLSQWLDRDAPSQPKPPIEIELQRKELEGRVEIRSFVATFLVIFALCFFSVYLLPVFTCEERERGILLAQVLSPASPLEILAAKFLFYPTFGMILGAMVAGIYSPPVLLRPFFWLSMGTTALGYLGVGLTISSLSTSQRKASMGALCYMLTVALLLFITQQFNIPGLQYLFLEYYPPRIMHAVLEGNVGPYIPNLIAAMVLAAGWTALATYLFRRYGWQ